MENNEEKNKKIWDKVRNFFYKGAVTGNPEYFNQAVGYGENFKEQQDPTKQGTQELSDNLAAIGVNGAWILAPEIMAPLTFGHGAYDATKNGLNIKNGLEMALSAMPLGSYSKTLLNKINSKGYDALISKNAANEFGSDVVVLKDVKPENIHILGSQQDIKSFQEFTGKGPNGYERPALKRIAFIPEESINNDKILLNPEEWYGIEETTLTKNNFGFNNQYPKFKYIWDSRSIKTPIKQINNFDKFLELPIEKQNDYIRYWNGEKYKTFKELQRNKKDLELFIKWVNKNSRL